MGQEMIQETIMTSRVPVYITSYSAGDEAVLAWSCVGPQILQEDFTAWRSRIRNLFGVETPEELVNEPDEFIMVPHVATSL